MAIFRLAEAEINTATAELSSNQLTSSQVEDIHSVMRGFLGTKLAKKYPLLSTLENAEDINGSQKCAKTLACLQRFNNNEFDNGGFAPTNANRSGFNFSIDRENFEVFKYMFGLFWDIPDELENRFNQDNLTTESSLINFNRGFIS